MAVREFSRICQEGIELRYSGETGERLDRIRTRLFWELGLLRELGIVRQFLIAADVARYARSQGILVGPGRGALVGSLVAFLAGITDVDPLRHGLLAERFFFSSRLLPLSIEMDVACSRCDMLCSYLEDRHGSGSLESVRLLPLEALDILEDALARLVAISNFSWNYWSRSELDWAAQQLFSDGDVEVSLLLGGDSTAKLVSRCYKVGSFSDLLLLLCFSQRSAATKPVEILASSTGFELPAAAQELLEETSGRVLYQEQILQLLHQLGGIPLLAGVRYLFASLDCRGEAMKNEFMAGCSDIGLRGEVAATLWQSILHAGFGVLKAHLVGQALVACWMAFMKVNHCREFEVSVEDCREHEDGEGIHG